MSGYNTFCSTRFKELNHLDGKERIAIVSKEWNELGVSEKEEWNSKVKTKRGRRTDSKKLVKKLKECIDSLGALGIPAAAILHKDPTFVNNELASEFVQQGEVKQAWRRCQRIQEQEGYKLIPLNPRNIHQWGLYSINE